MNIWDSIAEQINSIEELQPSVFTGLGSMRDANELSLNLIDSIPAYHESVNDIRARLTVALGLFKSMQTSDKSLALIPMSYLKGWDDSLIAIHEALNKLVGAFSNLEANGGIASINPANFDAISTNQTVAFNFGIPLQAMGTRLDDALDNFYRINVLFQRPDYSTLGSITDQFAAIFDEIATQKEGILKLAKESGNDKKNIEDIATKVNSELTKAQGMCARLEELKDSADSKLQAISNMQASAIQALPTIEETHTKAAALRKDIDAYQPQFETFQSQLDLRVRHYGEGDQKLEVLLKSLAVQEDEIKRINDSASAALNFATVAGLAKGFEDRRVALSTELGNAYNWYVGSVISLFLTTLIPAIYVVGQIFKVWDSNDFKYEYALVLLLLAVPSAIMTRFTSNRYNILFRLREQYAHKYSIAFSMDGFKKALQADDQNQLVATTFAQLSSNNPANYIDNRATSEKHPLPLWDKFLDLISPHKG